MRLVLNPGVTPYRLFDGMGLVIHARPALVEVIEEAKADPALLAHAEAAKGLVDADAEAVAITPELLRSRGRSGVLFAKAVARLVIESWEGVEDPDGSPAPVTPDRIDALLDLPPVYEAFTLRYLGRWLIVQAEKNDSSLSLNGISAGAQTTAKAARRRVKPAPAG